MARVIFLLSLSKGYLSFNRRRFFQKSTNQKQEMPVVAMFVNGSGRNEQYLQMTFQGCILPNFDSFGQVVSNENIFQKSTNQKYKLHVAAMFVNGSRRNEHFFRRPAIDASSQVSVHLAKWFQRRFLKIGQSETRVAFGGHVC